jgi:ketosteroid isomerase-like protein
VTGATNAELARRAFGAANRQPKPDYEVVNALYHPDHEFVAQLTDVEGTTFRGAQGFREWLTNMRDAWQSWEWEVERVSEIDDDRVLLVGALSLRGRRGGVPLEHEAATVMTLRDGKIVRTESYPSVEQALQAAGVRE